MAYTKKNLVLPAPEPTLAERHGRASRSAQLAVSLFMDAAAELEQAADELDRISDEAAVIADEHTARAIASTQEADLNRDRANKIRNFLA